MSEARQGQDARAILFTMSTSALEPTAAVGVNWDLSALFAGLDDPRIEATWAEAHRRADAFATANRGRVATLAQDGHALAGAIREYESLSNEASKPVHFANLVFAADVSKAEHGAFLQAQMERASELRVKLMFFELELQELEPAVVAAALASPDLQAYAHFLHTRLAYRPHKLSETEEVLLEEVANTGSRAWQRLHEEVYANHTFHYTDPHTGEVQDLSIEEVLDTMKGSDRAVRKAGAEAFTAGLQETRRVSVFLYNTLLADKRLEDRLRKFEHPESSRHLANELDKETVDLVTGLCRDRSDIVARYYRVKREILGVDQLTEYDRYAPLFEAKRKVGWPEAQTIVTESFARLHPDMETRAREFFEKGWIDAEPRPGKSGGAFCSYNTPDTHPVLLQTYLGSMDDVMTLAHEMGHGVHASLSRSQTPFNFDGTLPLAELSSIFAEMVTFERLVSEADDRDRLALYAQKIEGIFASVNRQAAMFRFEQRCHAKRREEGELSAEDFEALWHDEIQSMFLDSVALGEGHRCWWQYVGHFVFAPFYVYAYAFGELLSLGVYEKAKAEGPSFVDRYVEVLRLGGSKTPHELMGLIGIDLKDKAFWLGGFAVIERMVGEFEALWARQKGA